MSARLEARYWIETPCPPEEAAATMAGEQSSGTFLRLRDETDELKSQHGAIVERISILDTISRPSLPGASAPRTAQDRPYTQAEVTVSWPAANLDPSLPNLLATVAGNLFELKQFSGLKLLDIQLPDFFLRGFQGPNFGITGTRQLCNVFDRPILGTIIKPSVGLSPSQTAERVKLLINAGLDFIKDDELQCDSPHSPFEDRVKCVTRVINEYADRVGRKPMFAFNLSGDLDQMRRRHDQVLEHGGTCIMASLNWVGFSGMQALAAHSKLPIHGHRNGWGLFSRSEAIGISYTVWQKLWRLAGVDHLHCNGLRNKFCESDDSVTRSAQACLKPLRNDSDRALPVLSSGQWAGQIPDTFKALKSPDFMYLCGGGVAGHPSGAEAGVLSLRQSWEAAELGLPLVQYATEHRELKEAIDFFSR